MNVSMNHLMYHFLADMLGKSKAYSTTSEAQMGGIPVVHDS